MHSDPIVSVIIPVYNAENTIERALHSVAVQTVGAEVFEIIIINDGSTDRTRPLIEEYILKNPGMDILLINQPNGGVSKARNAGLKIAKGDYIALLDADDEWLPCKTEKQLALLEDKTLRIDFLATRRNSQQILLPYRVENHLAEITFRKLLLRNEAQPSTVMFKRKILSNTGYFNDDQRYAEDLNYWMRIAENNTMYILDESLLIAGGGKRTFGVSGLSANLSLMEKGFQRNLKEMRGMKKISSAEYRFLALFYKAKYLLLLTRTFYFNLKNKNRQKTAS